MGNTTQSCSDEFPSHVVEFRHDRPENEKVSVGQWSTPLSDIRKACCIDECPSHVIRKACVIDECPSPVVEAIRRYTKGKLY